jgi:hypothetical protein
MIDSSKLGSLYFRFIAIVAISVVAFSYTHFTYSKFICGGILLVAGIINSWVSVFTTHRFNDKTINTDVILLLSSFWILDQLNTVASEKINSVFWTLFVVELAAQTLSFKKFKQPIRLEPLLIKFYNHFQILFFAYLTVFAWEEVFLYIFILVGLLTNIDYLLTIYWLPYYVPNVKSAWHAFKLNKEYKKIYNR